MNNNCKYAGGGYCMCDACQAMREMMEYMESEEFNEKLKVSEADAKKIFREMEELLRGEKNHG